MPHYISSRVAEGLHKLDLTDDIEVKEAITQFKPGFLIHCAAQRFPEKVDLDPEGATKINVETSRYLAQISGMSALFTTEIR
jgi:dTDP-4-dehydrorhamnose reductase